MNDLPLSGEGELTLLKRSLNFKRRVAVRYRCPLATAGRLTLGEEEVPGEEVWVLNLSTSGVGLLLSRPLEEGRNVVISLTSTPEKMELAATVVHATQQANGDWIVGCALEQPLSNDVLDQLLG